MTAARGGGLGVAALAGVLALPACGSPTVVPDPAGDADAARGASGAAAPADAVVVLRIDPDGRVRQHGSADVAVKTLSVDGGRVTPRGASPGAGPAMRLPAFSPDPGPYPRAVLAVTPAGPRDLLEPGTRPFAWGADFRVDSDTGTSAVDNGDNLVQRGLSNDPGFFKAELDQRRPGCTVTGSEDTLVVHASERVVAGRWYHLRCELTPGELAVYVTELPADDTPRSFASHISGFVGDVRFEDRTPLTVGGKVGLDGKPLPHATDQFNGRVAAPYLGYL
ncbi:hypothetical protein GHK92_02690 [Nocardioides sp. dk4132]|uniref:hypothetical protein n=1 Tax=unclassified Nocardioides TaxID=2615069 RepID=UPI0012964C1C|nr:MULTISPECIES: hypothetical protein [unclassified Nocardioides]MQW74770.1 hypothetical protein [Nocardioides sp. dk4132]QGA06667.1 hypothetical protein GFH29_04130 [Nocardioides sp. dk884]